MIVTIIILFIALGIIVGISFWLLLKSEEQQNKFKYEMAKWLH